MSNFKFSELLTSTAERAKQVMYGRSGGVEIEQKELDRSAAILKELMSTKNSRDREIKIDMREALTAADASILFPRVISDILYRPKEPYMIGQTLLSKVIKVDSGVKSVEFPVFGALRAFDMAETGAYREQSGAFTQHSIEIKTNKVGLKVALSEDLINDSMWDMLSLYVESAGYAMLRRKEEKIFEEFSSTGHKVFDNTGTSAQWLGGRSSAQTRNYSVTFDNFIVAMGALVSHGYVPTDIIMHPMAWTIFATDPILRNVMYTQGQIGQQVWSSQPQFDQTMNVPWNVAYQISPFVPYTQNYSFADSLPASALGAVDVTDIYIVDRNQSCIILQRDEMSVEEFNDPNRDILSMKFRERYGVGTPNGGRATSVLSNVVLEQNFQPVASFYSVTPA